MYFSKCISQNVFLKMYFSKCISQYVFLKMYLSKCISQNVFLKMLQTGRVSKMSTISSSLIFFTCLVSFSSACLPSVITEPLSNIGWNGMDVEWFGELPFGISDFCPSIAGFSCNTITGFVPGFDFYGSFSLDSYDYVYAYVNFYDY